MVGSKINFILNNNYLQKKYLFFITGIGLTLFGVFHLHGPYSFPSSSELGKYHIICGLMFNLKYIVISLGIYFCLLSLIFSPKNIEGYNCSDFLLLVLVCLVLMFYSVSIPIRYLNNDEYEHLHNAWMMRVHTIPYYSLYFKHSPLLEWIISFFMMLSNESVLIIQTMRFFMFFISCISLYLTYRIAEEIFQSHRHGLVSVLLILCNYVWLKSSFEIRPDNIMIFFALLSFLSLIYFHKTSKATYLVLFIISALFSFLGKQNAAVFILSLGIIFLYQLLVSETPVREKIIILSFVLSCILSFFLLLPNDILLKLGFQFLIPSQNKFWPLDHLKTIMVFSPVIFMFFVIQMFFATKLKTDYPIFVKYVLCVSITTFIFLFLMNRPWIQEMLVMTAFMSVFCSDLIVRIMNKGNIAILIILVLILIPPAGYVPRIYNWTMTNDLVITRTILEISERDDQVFDAYGKPIFRHHPLEPKYLQYFPERFSSLDRVKNSKVKFLIKDKDYYPRFPEETLKWFDDNFVPTKENPNIFIRKSGH